MSFGPRSPTGVRAWDTFQGLVETTRRARDSLLGLSADRLTQAGTVPPLAAVIAARAAETPLGASWAAA